MSFVSIKKLFILGAIIALAMTTRAQSPTTTTSATPSSTTSLASASATNSSSVAVTAPTVINANKALANRAISAAKVNGPSNLKPATRASGRSHSNKKDIKKVQKKGTTTNKAKVNQIQMKINHTRSTQPKPANQPPKNPAPSTSTSAASQSTTATVSTSSTTGATPAPTNPPTVANPAVPQPKAA
ncbi:hypothetical protein BJ085DRAFT_34054 [Dimargaris cristalligena]|uniref:Uncharacterized protein n=1 Tax=Dimargaris cristalligena TaxID=215637 RepID=A0A4P9ZJL7_9FUNG|nr:hypothetical protein BJ085DRAFT_34054 [Dimargaris cristalligena]|eukprot:RKP33407.1 hypothetical protein BJ085DRAFT_34054 [Dimargaris cristalligena]